MTGFELTKISWTFKDIPRNWEVVRVWKISKSFPVFFVGSYWMLLLFGVVKSLPKPVFLKKQADESSPIFAGFGFLHQGWQVPGTKLGPVDFDLSHCKAVASNK